jgi:hypothetical protein
MRSATGGGDTPAAPRAECRPAEQSLSAMHKAFAELRQLGLVGEKRPLRGGGASGLVRLQGWAGAEKCDLAALDSTGGGGGIRTHGPLARPTVFKTVALDHSATPPVGMMGRRDGCDAGEAAGVGV